MVLSLRERQVIGVTLGRRVQATSSLVIIPAVAIALVGFAEPASIARTLACEDQPEWNAERRAGIGIVT